MIIFVHSYTNARLKNVHKMQNVRLILKILPFLCLSRALFLHFLFFCRCCRFCSFWFVLLDFSLLILIRRYFASEHILFIYAHRSIEWATESMTKCATTVFQSVALACHPNSKEMILVFFSCCCSFHFNCTRCAYYARKFKRSLIHWTNILQCVRTLGTNNYGRTLLSHSVLANSEKQQQQHQQQQQRRRQRKRRQQ